MNSNKSLKITSRKSQVHGFTLLELIIVLLIGSILLAWGVPGYQRLKARRMVTEFANEMVYSFTQARAEAVRYGTNVEVEPLGAWQNGWTVTALGVDGSADILISQQDPVDGRMTLVQSGSLQGKVVFNSLGGLTGVDEGVFRLANNSIGTELRRIDISMVGKMKVVRL